MRELKGLTSRRTVIWVCLGVLCYPCFAQQNRLYNLEIRQIDQGVQVVAYCDNPVKYHSIPINNPPRLILYLWDVICSFPRRGFVLNSGPISEVKLTQWTTNPGVVRLVMDFSYPTKYQILGGTDSLAIIVEEEADLISSDQAVGIDVLNNTILSMDYHEAEITNVLRLLAQQNGLNIVASDEVKGKITLSLTNVTLKEALDNILKANGYNYIINGNVIFVKPAEKTISGEMITKVYRLKYIDAYNLKEAISDVLSSHAKVRVFSEDFQPRSRGKEGQPENKEGCRYSVLIVTDLPENIKRIDHIVEELDVSAPQIMIEAKLIEVSPIEQKKLGIDWDKSITASLLDEYILPSGRSQSYSVFSEGPAKGKQLVFGKLSATEFTAVLEFLKTKTNAKLISNPRILASDNQESSISVGTTVPIPQIHRGVAGQGDIITFMYKDVNISLKVTAHITEDRHIVMAVNPVIEEITGEVVVDKNKAPITSKRSVSTVVSVKDGETIVIGGLIKENTIKTIKKVWLLGDIPLLGYLFRHQALEKKQTDLLIFITPRIVE